MDIHNKYQTLLTDRGCPTNTVVTEYLDDALIIYLKIFEQPSHQNGKGRVKKRQSIHFRWIDVLAPPPLFLPTLANNCINAIIQTRQKVVDSCMREF